MEWEDKFRAAHRDYLMLIKWLKYYEIELFWLLQGSVQY
jgi:hypothetical protein